MYNKKTYNEYDTYGASFDGKSLIFYCYNDKITNIEEIVLCEHKALHFAVKKRYRLFMNLDSVDFNVGLN
jgi:hypothetical protein